MHVVQSRLVSYLVALFYLLLNLIIVNFRFSLFELWVVIEIITFVFIALSLLNFIKSGPFSSGLVSYFLIQSGVSIVLLFRLVFYPWYPSPRSFIRVVTVFTKVGILPFGFWIYPVFKQLSNFTLLLAITTQKLAPFIILLNIRLSNSFIWMILVLNGLLGGLMAFSASRLVSLLIFRSIANNSWFLLVIWRGSWLWLIVYFLVYAIGVGGSILSSSEGLSNRFVLSLSGLPPFPLFFTKLVLLYWVFIVSPQQLTLALLFFFLLLAITIRSAYVRYLASFLITKHTQRILIS